MVFGNISVMHFSCLLVSHWHSACWYYHSGVEGGVRGAVLIQLCLHGLLSNCSVFRMTQTDVRSSIGCNVTKHIRDGYSRLVKVPRSIQTPLHHPALLSSPFCMAILSLSLIMFVLTPLLSSLFVSTLLSFAYLLHVCFLLSSFVSALHVYLCYSVLGYLQVLQRQYFKTF